MTNDPRLRMIEANGIHMRIAEAGEGPVVLLIHGWPHLWYSWRHQLPALADAGYRAIAPDMRGFGGTDAPPDVESYRMDVVVDDLVGLLDAIGEPRATLVGHDMGAAVSWIAALLKPERFSGVLGMSDVHSGYKGEPFLDRVRKAVGDSFVHLLYHNEPGGVAEAEYDANPRALLEQLLVSPDAPRAKPTITDPKRSAGGWIGRMGAPLERPAWLSEADLDYYVAEFTRSGFRGGVNYYRNIDHRWQLLRDIDDVIRIPSAFVSGALDHHGSDQARLQEVMMRVMSDLRFVRLIPNVGHDVNQQAPEAVNQALLEFLSMLRESDRT